MDASMNKIFTPFTSEESDEWFHIQMQCLLYDEEAVSLSDLLGNEEPDVATNPKYDIKDNPSEPKAIDKDQKQNNLANVALMDSNPSERENVKDNDLSGSQMNNSLFSNQKNIYCPEFLSNIFGSKYEIQDNPYAPMECEWTNASTENPLSPNISNALATINPLPPKDVTQSSIHNTGEDIDMNTSNQKRTKPELVQKGGACTQCRCKKSKCLKLYCECFLAGVLCKESCLCQDCFNKPSHKEEVLQARQKIDSRYKHAFGIRSSDSSSQIEDDPKRTLPFKLPNRGCTCKTSKCVMKYCQCFKGGIGCSPSCKCKECENTYGRNDTKVEEIEAVEKSVVEKTSEEINSLIDDLALLITQLHISSLNQEEIVEESEQMEEDI